MTATDSNELIALIYGGHRLKTDPITADDLFRVLVAEYAAQVANGVPDKDLSWREAVTYATSLIAKTSSEEAAKSVSDVVEFLHREIGRANRPEWIPQRS